MRATLTLRVASCLTSRERHHSSRDEFTAGSGAVSRTFDTYAHDVRQQSLGYQTAREALLRIGDGERIARVVRDVTIDAQMGVLYWRFFPNQWRASRKSRLTTQNTMSDRQYELLNLLPRLIPFAEFYGDMDDHRPFGVPCAMMGVDIEEGLYDEDLLQFDTARLAFLNLMGGAWAYDLEDHLVNKRGFAHPFPEVRDLNAWYVDVDVFRDHCKAKRDRRWRWVADAVCIAGRCTDNNFLDWNMDNYSYFDEFITECGWTLKGVRRLVREAKAAQRLLTRFSRACNWLNREPERWPEVFEAFDASWRQRERQLWSSDAGGEDATKPDDDDP